jgi:hypothetical protein
MVVEGNDESSDRQRAILNEIAEGSTVSGELRGKLKLAFPSIANLMEESNQTDIFVANNGPQDSFTDVLIVNNLTKELWLVQCKSFLTKVQLDCADELAQMGHPNYPQKPDAGLYREALKQALGMTTVRYFFCSHVTPRLIAELAESIKPLPRDVFVLSNAFGFQFTPIDLENQTEIAVQHREWLEEADLEEFRKLNRNGV